MCSLCIASLRGPPIGGQDRDGASYRCSAPYTLCLFEAFPSRGNEGFEEKNSESYTSRTISAFSPFGGERSEPITRVLIMLYDTGSQSRNVLASPLGEEGHEVAKGWTVVILIMILYADVTAAGGIIKLIAHRAIRNPRPEGPSNLRNLRTLRTLRPRGRSILRTFPSEPSEPSEPGPRSGPIMPPLNPFIHFSNDI